METFRRRIDEGGAGFVSWGEEVKGEALSSDEEEDEEFDEDFDKK